MIYFYAGLGAAMLTGIMLLFEVGLSLTGQSLLEEQSYFNSYQDRVNSADQLFLRMLTQTSDLRAIGTARYGDDLCQQILCRIKGTGCNAGNMKIQLYAPLKGYSTAVSIPSIGMWSSSCVLEHQLEDSGSTHRLLIRPNRERFDLGYELYSCILDGSSVRKRCLFERGV